MSVLRNIATLFATGGSVQLTAKQFKGKPIGCPAIATLLNNFWAGTLNLSSINVVNNSPGLLEVTAGLSDEFLGQQGLQISLRFKTAGAAAQLEAKVSGFAQEVYLADAYAEWQYSLFREFSLNINEVNLDSAGSFDIKLPEWANYSSEFKKETKNLNYPIPAMQLRATHLATPAVVLFTEGADLSTLPTEKPIVVSGKIGMYAYKKELLPVASFQFANKGFLLFGSQSKGAFYTGLAALPIVSQNEAYVKVVGNVAAGYQLSAKVNSELSASFYNLSFMPLDVKLSFSMSDLDSLLNMHEEFKGGDAAKLFPSGFPKLPSSVSVGLSASILAQVPRIYSIGAEFEITGNWDVFPGFLKFKDFDLQLLLFPAGSAYEPSEVAILAKTGMELAGAGFTGSISLRATYLKPGFNFWEQAFSLEMKEGDSIDVGQFFEYMGIPVPAFDQLRCSRLGIRGDVGNKTFSVDCELKMPGSWSFCGLTLKGTGLYLYHSPSYNTASVNAEVDIAGTTLDILVQYNDGSYTFEVDFTKEASTPSLQEYLNNHPLDSGFNAVTQTLFTAYKALNLQKVVVQYSNAENFSLEIDVEVNTDNVLPVTFILSRTNGKYGAKLSAGDVGVGGSGNFYFVNYEPPGKEPAVLDFKNALLKANNKSGTGLSEADLEGLPNIRITLEKALLAYKRPVTGTSKSGAVAYLQLKEEISLSDIPIIGKQFQGSDTLGISLHELLYFKAGAIDKADLSQFSSNFPDVANIDPAKGDQFVMAMELIHGKDRTPLELGAELPASSPKVKPAVAEPPQGANKPTQDISDGLKWKKLNKHFGPLYVKSIGFGFANNELTIGITGSAKVGGFTGELIGLKITSPLDKFKPRFDLDGIAVDYQSAGTNIAGILEKTHTPEGYLEFNGGLIISTGSVSIAALGSFAGANPPSLFVYGFLGLPMNGQPILSVTGLAAGFGINRTLTLPPPEGIPDFPLLKVAEGGGGLSSDDLLALADNMKDAFKVEMGTYWLATGIRINILELIDGFILVAPVFSEKSPSLNVLGILTLVVPSDSPNPIAEIQLAFSVSYDFNDKVLQAKGGLTANSWIIDKNAVLRGDFLFVNFFKDQTSGVYNGQPKGNYVISAGGFGPLLKPMPGVPHLKPISFNWAISDHLTIVATAYFALVPHALAVGGSLTISFQDGGSKFAVSAVAHLSADFLIEWKPLHYLAIVSASLDLDVKVWLLFCTKHIRMSASADLAVYGPPFSGHGTVRIHFIFTFHAHISWGNGSMESAPRIGWTEFESSFLPEKNTVCSIIIEQGLIDQIEKGGVEWWIVDPKTLRVAISSAIPATSINLPWHKVTATHPVPITSFAGSQEVGIKPMGITMSNYESVMNIVLAPGHENRSMTGKELEDKFIIEQIWQNQGPAVWGGASSLSEELVNCLLGLRYSLREVAKAESFEIDLDKMSYEYFGGSTLQLALANSLTGVVVEKGKTSISPSAAMHNLYKSRLPKDSEEGLLNGIISLDTLKQLPNEILAYN